ncbi:hypothetical protein [Catenulispora rubra]|uniref:hypothetical protein n=1 Tax=Catenulispora rubra TaxID=280293 RepID=UPI0034DD19D3
MLRPELTPPFVAESRLRELSQVIENIADVIRHGDGLAAGEAVTAFNKATGHTYTDYDFISYNETRDLEEFAREAARPAWPKVADASRAELIEIVRRIQAADPELDYYLLLLGANTPHPRVADLIFYPPAELREGSAEDIVDAALSYQAIAL